MNKNSAAYAEYISNTQDILSSPAILKLGDYRQHIGTSRLNHSISVSYKSFLIARFFGWNSRAAARGGLMHDMFYYNFKESPLSAREHCRSHPKEAFDNADTNFSLTKLEGEIIKNHMWLAVWTPPKHKEAFLVAMVDKYCAATEAVKGLFSKAILRPVSYLRH